jgi:hypothetical protein
MQEDILEYLKDNFFKPNFVDGKPMKAREYYQNLFKEKGRMSTENRTQFFNEAYGEILFDLFLRWCQTELHEKELREALYQNTLALGSIKVKLQEYENYANNIEYIEKSRGLTDEEDEEDGESA